MSEVKKLVAKLQQWYWSPMPPESYVVHTAAGKVGIDKVFENAKKLHQLPGL